MEAKHSPEAKRHMMVLMQAGTSGQGRPACMRGIMCLLASRRLPRWFSPGKPPGGPGPSWPPLAGKSTAGSCRLPTKRMVHASRDAGTWGVPGDGTPPRFCLECGCRACANPTNVLFAAFSRPLSRCFQVLDRPAVLGLWCADETSSTQGTICVLPCTCRLCAEKMQGKVDVQMGATRICKLSCCQDVIAPLSQEKYLYLYASCC